ncbi:ec332849-a26c-402b-b9d9-61edefed2592 [Sclerotinia trifoliorum]|uniref:Ec332849-a26c-402b-b9d9-61edefed2592 n=1 Tax=Sclerotinia trifoliorum TaxID=28548 RepID=A0A8H2ZLE7_9HELO|nr:ec332849-a26c-402b-b9d9-61edefed2592 [Sclerotinia trifoliorum]
MDMMNIHLIEVWSELLRSALHNDAVLRELLERRPEIQRAKDLNNMFVNYLSIIHKVFSVKMGGELVGLRVRMPSDPEFVEMLQLLVRYTEDITAWVEEHDRTGAPWISIDEFWADSLLQVDMQCQRWWVLADMTIFNQATSSLMMHPPLTPNEEREIVAINEAISSFGMPPSLSAIEESLTQSETFKALLTPASSFTKHQSPSTASSSFSCPFATTSFNQNQIAAELPASWNNVRRLGCASHDTPFCGFDRNSSDDERDYFLFSDAQDNPVTTPSASRLEQAGFISSRDPSILVQTSANKQNGFFKPVPPPIRKIAIPRLQKGSFRPLPHQTQNSMARSSPAIEQASDLAIPRKRRYTKISAETLSPGRQKRQALGHETPQHNPTSADYGISTPGSEFSPGTLRKDSLGSAVANSGEPYNANSKTATLHSNVNNIGVITSQTDWNNTVSVAFNSNQGAHIGVTSQKDWDDAVLVAFNSNQEGVIQAWELGVRQ